MHSAESLQTVEYAYSRQYSNNSNNKKPNQSTKKLQKNPNQNSNSLRLD